MVLGAEGTALGGSSVERWANYGQCHLGVQACCQAGFSGTCLERETVEAEFLTKDLSGCAAGTG